MTNAADARPPTPCQIGTSASAGIVNDEIYITEEQPLRTIIVASHCPHDMARNTWKVEDFELHKELYRGKTSLLYMATDKRSGIDVALKLYRKRKLSTLNKYQVEREIRIHIKLNHPNIINLYAAFEDDKNVYMVQEFAGGGDLFEDLKRSGGNIKEKYAVRDVIIPFLDALSYLHGLGIIHRDIKPENILLTKSRVIKVADFGLSINKAQERPVTRAGTLDYMAPEVLVCPDKRRPEENKDKVLLAYTEQVDAWACGILLYELMVGYPPFEQESRAGTYEHIMYKEPKMPSWMSEDVKKFIAAALCKNASNRPCIASLMAQPLIQAYRNKTLTTSDAIHAKAAAAAVPSGSPKSVLDAPLSPGDTPTRGPDSDTNLHPPTPTKSAPLQAHAAAAHESTTAVSETDTALPHGHHHHPAQHPLSGIQEDPVAVLDKLLGVAKSSDNLVGKIGTAADNAGALEVSSETQSGENSPVARPATPGGSNYVFDEDASYSITDFNSAIEADGTFFSSMGSGGFINSSKAGGPSAGTRVGSVSSQQRQALVSKSRLGIAGQGSSSAATSPTRSLITAANNAKGGVAASVTRPVTSMPPGLVEIGAANEGGAGDGGGAAAVGGSSTYYKPKNGILSSDIDLPVPMTVSHSQGNSFTVAGSGGSSRSQSMFQLRPNTTATVTSSGGHATAATAKQSGFGGNMMERPTLEKLMQASSSVDSLHDSQHAQQDASRPSALGFIGKLLNKNTTTTTTTTAHNSASKPGAHDHGYKPGGALPGDSTGMLSPSSPSSPRIASVPSPSQGSASASQSLMQRMFMSKGATSISGGGAKITAEDLLAERADSIIMVDRTGSVLGAPTMQMRAKTPMTGHHNTNNIYPGNQPVTMTSPSQARSAGGGALTGAMGHAASNASASHGSFSVGGGAAGGGSKGLGLRSALLAEEFGDGLVQRLGSEMTLKMALPASTIVGSSGKSFTSPNSPALRKLQTGPIVNKIQEYVAAHAPHHNPDKVH